MAPTRQKKNRSLENEERRDKAQSPTGRSPIKKGPMQITLRQKQALIDNLQLEVTERARKLRAQYAMQAQGLRTRIEIRINRIPMALRSANMGELFAKSNVTTGKAKPDNPLAQIRRNIASPLPKTLLQESQINIKLSPSTTRIKRPSDEITDKENDNLANPKKRLKAPVPPERTTSRPKLQPNQVLSPRSANSRTLPGSPVHPDATAEKTQLTKPISPLKPTAPVPVGGAAGILFNMVEKAKPTRAAAAGKGKSSSSDLTGAGRGKKAPQAAATLRAGKKKISNGSESSEMSTGTAIVKKAAPKRAPAKKAAVGNTRGAGSNIAKKSEAAAATAKRPTVTRILRKRN